MVRFAFPLGISMCHAPGCPAPGFLTLLAALSLSLLVSQATLGPGGHWLFPQDSILPSLPRTAAEHPSVPQQRCSDTPSTHAWFLGKNKFLSTVRTGFGT